VQQTQQGHAWVVKRNGTCVPINPETVDATRFQMLAVRVGNRYRARVLEHLLPLKMFGLQQVMLDEPSAFLPYDGSSRLFLDRVLPHCDRRIMEVPVHTLIRPVMWKYPDLRGGREAFTRLEPLHDGRLLIDVTINYPGLGEAQESYVFPNEPLLRRVARSKSQGWPRHRYWVSLACSKIGIWYHHDHVMWPQGIHREEVLRRFLDHRCLDILGALGVLTNGWHLSARVVSVCSGHHADMQVCRMAHGNTAEILV
jgi:hypothetical protein